jgi:hypothetical protein
MCLSENTVIGYGDKTCRLKDCHHIEVNEFCRLTGMSTHPFISLPKDIKCNFEPGFYNLYATGSICYYYDGENWFDTKIIGFDKNE